MAFERGMHTVSWQKNSKKGSQPSKGTHKSHYTCNGLYIYIYIPTHTQHFCSLRTPSSPPPKAVVSTAPPSQLLHSTEQPSEGVPLKLALAGSKWSHLGSALPSAKAAVRCSSSSSSESLFGCGHTLAHVPTCPHRHIVRAE